MCIRDRLYSEGTKLISIDVKGPCELTAAALEVDDEVEVINLSLIHIFRQRRRSRLSAGKLR